MRYVKAKSVEEAKELFDGFFSHNYSYKPQNCKSAYTLPQQRWYKVNKDGLDDAQYTFQHLYRFYLLSKIEKCFKAEPNGVLALLGPGCHMLTVIAFGTPAWKRRGPVYSETKPKGLSNSTDAELLAYHRAHPAVKALKMAKGIGKFGGDFVDGILHGLTDVLLLPDTAGNMAGNALVKVFEKDEQVSSWEGSVHF